MVHDGNSVILPVHNKKTLLFDLSFSVTTDNAVKKRATQRQEREAECEMVEKIDKEIKKNWQVSRCIIKTITNILSIVKHHNCVLRSIDD